VNRHAAYRRHNYRPTTSVPTPVTVVESGDLAHYRDPSLPAGEGQTPANAVKGVAWVRPTELATFLTPMVGRGIDLHAELMRRARPTPATTTRTLQRGVPQSPAPTQPASGTEGVAL
jgi:hypothetical protein